MPRVDRRLTLAHQWLPQRNKFGPERRVRFVVVSGGGYVAMCKRYRRFVKRAGRLVTLAEKRRVNPSVDQLIGLWDRRDLWNALYGTPPMFMFTRRSWRANRERFVKSYRTATPVARET